MDAATVSWHQTLRRAIAQDDGKRLRRAAEALLTHAADGDHEAIAMIADRIDGKALQAVSVAVTQERELIIDDAQALIAKIREHA